MTPSIQDTCEEVARWTEARNADSAKRLMVLAEVLRHHHDQPDIDARTRGGAAAVIWSLFTKPMMLHSLGWPDLCVLEVYGLVEYFSRRDLGQLLEAFKAQGRSHPWLEKKTAAWLKNKQLDQLAKVGQALGAWNAKDVKFLQELTKLRDALIHKRADWLAHRWGAGSMHVLGIDHFLQEPEAAEVQNVDRLLSDADSAQAISDAVSVLVSLSEAWQRTRNESG
ncbi:MAG TPA: hypothetical protein VGM03_16610 [Phycisphaerae bacterium]|jgi:hypothetical protein